VPRQPDLKNKSNRLVYVPLDTSEIKLSHDVKALCVQDGITIRDFLSEAITLAFKVHHWPPGNPQLTLECSLQKTLVRAKCKCGKEAVSHGLHISSQKEVDVCKKCFSEIIGRYDKKLWNWTNETKEMLTP
jgi:hypothetical protein